MLPRTSIETVLFAASIVICFVVTIGFDLTWPRLPFADAREVLPPIAYFNRTMYPPLVLYKGSGEHLRLTQKIQLLTNEYDYEVLTAKNEIRARQIAAEIQKWTALRESASAEGPNADESRRSALQQLEALDGPLPERPLLSMAIVSDIQYAPKEEEKRRHFKMSKMKLQHAVSEIIANWSQHVDLMMNLGDTVDDTIATILPEIMPVFDQLAEPASDAINRKNLPIPVFHMLGNHDFLGTQSKDFDSIHKMMKMPSRYYAVDVVSKKSSSSQSHPRTFRLIVLDGNDLAIYSTDVGSEKRKQAEAILGLLKRRRAKNAQIFNGALSNPQIDWLKSELQESCDSGKLVLIFIHHPMRPRNEPTNLWNDVEVVPIIASYGCVCAVINGHAHKFLYDFQHTVHRDVHFITFGGMVQSPFTSWGFVDVFEDKLKVHGLVFGRPIDYVYDISDKSIKYHQKHVHYDGEKNGVKSGKSTEIFVSSAPESGKGLRMKDQITVMETKLDEISRQNAHGIQPQREEEDLSIPISTTGKALLSASSFALDTSGVGSDLLTSVGIFICLTALVVIIVTLKRGFKWRGVCKALAGGR